MVLDALIKRQIELQTFQESKTLCVIHEWFKPFPSDPKYYVSLLNKLLER